MKLIPAFALVSPTPQSTEKPARLPDLMMLANRGSSDDEIEVRRRRRTEGGGVPRERAEAPQRERPSGGGGQSLPPIFSSGGGTSPTGGGKRPSMLLILILLAAMLLCGVPVSNLLGGGSSTVVEEPTPAPVEATVAIAQPTRTARPTSASALPQGAGGDTWTVMLYQDADDKVLEQDIYIDLNEAERIGSTSNMNIVAQVDRYRAGFTGDGDWTSTKRFYITQDDDLRAVHSQQVADIGEANMADGNTLVDFVTWAIKSYPADKYALILSDHGMGWPGGFSDPNPGGSGNRSIPLEAQLDGDYLYLNELDNALSEISAQTGVDKLELVGLDACLMAQAEVFSALAPHARYAVASEEVEPSLGWAYAGFLEALQKNPGMDGAELGSLIVDSYISEDQRIVDSQERAVFTGQGSGLGGLFGMVSQTSAESLAQQVGKDVTISAVDLEAFSGVMDSLNALSYTLQNANQQSVARARTYAESYTSIFGDKVPASYIDLGSFVSVLQQSINDSNVQAAGDQVLSAVKQAVIAEKHGSGKRGSTGISIYFPNSQLYQLPAAGPRSYTAIADRFAREALWDDFLVYHYTGHEFEAETRAAAVPQASAAVRGPGAGTITVGPVVASSRTAVPGSPVTLRAPVSGENIGYVYFFTGFVDTASRSIFVADNDYLESPETREVNGLYYPDWNKTEFTLKFDWDPVMFALDDGVNRVVAALQPQSYGETYEETVYTVDGTYTFADSGDQRHARLFFMNGELRQVYGFEGSDETGAPREILPSEGDTFTVLETWLDLDDSGKVKETVRQDGETLTFGGETIRWVELDAAAGSYVVGFIVSDLDGNQTAAYSQITVK